MILAIILWGRLQRVLLVWFSFHVLQGRLIKSLIFQRSLLDYTNMTGCFSIQLDTLSSGLCSNMEIDSSEADPCSICRWRQIDNANLKYSIWMYTCLGKAVHSVYRESLRKRLSVYVFNCFPFGFEGKMWDLIVSVPDYCLSLYSAKWSLFGCLILCI